MKITQDKEYKIIQSKYGKHLFVTNGSRLFDIPDADKNLNFDDLLESVSDRIYIDDTPLTPPKLHSISLNVSQVCNMGCLYCYADEGKFGGKGRLMEESVAFQTVDYLLESSEEGSTIVLGFMGGEPLINRDLVHSTTHYAFKRATETNRKVQFSITTNGTLIEEEDAKLFSQYPFNVAFSIDGPQERNDALRPMKNGQGSYEKIINGLDLIKKFGRPKHLSARVTVSPRTGELLPILDHLVELGFDEVGFAAVVVSPDSNHEFDSSSFIRFTKDMIACGEKAKSKLLLGEHYPFGNFEIALQEIHRGSHKPYPCGAGAAYLSANAEGDLFACHRLVDDQNFAMGNINSGADDVKRSEILKDKHVNFQEPCSSCWARYLCGGGCYHEVTHRGRNACDYIRDWLSYCIQAYAEISTDRPEYFNQSNVMTEQNTYSASTF